MFLSPHHELRLGLVKGQGSHCYPFPPELRTRFYITVMASLERARPTK